MRLGVERGYVKGEIPSQRYSFHVRAPGAGLDVCPNKRCSLSQELRREDQAVLRALDRWF